MTRTRWWTIAILVGVTVSLIAWDVYAVLQPGAGTISEVILYYVQRHPVYAFLLGVCAGHWCWPQPSNLPK